MASIQRRTTRGGESWRVVFRINGRQRVVTFDLKHNAQAWSDLIDKVGPEKALAVLDLDNPNTGPKMRTTKEQVLSHTERLTGVTDGTRRTYTRMAGYALGRLEHVPVAAVTREDAAAWVNDMARSGLAEKTMRNRHGLLYAAFDTAISDGLITDNPFKGQRIKRTHRDDDEMVFLEPAEFAVFVSHFKGQNRALVTFLVGTGVRFGEATALQVGDIDLTAGTARVRRAWKHTGKAARELGPTKSRRSTRTVRFGVQVADAITPLMAGRAASALLFTNRNGNPIGHASFWSNAWAPAVRRFAGDEIGRRVVGGGRTVECTLVEGPGKRPRPHDLRHTFVSWSIRAGVPLPVIQRQLGHESITTTVDRYGHLAASDFDALAALTDAALSLPRELPSR